MPIRNLEKLFYPRSVAVVGASNRDGEAGHVVMQNLLQGGFEGPIMPVAAGEQAIAGVLAYPEVTELPLTPDLAVICGRQQSLPNIIHQLGERGTRAAILLADNLSAPHNGGRSEQAPAFEEARRYDLRILGPECMGVMVPGIGLNASIAHAPALPGGVAFVSQSSTIGLGVLDWARERDIGFSYFVSAGGAADVDIADLIDYLGNDPMTRAILLYIEEIRHGRAFLSAGRGASRNKPVLVIRSGRTLEGRRTTFGDGHESGSDDVYDAAIRRAGMLRVYGFNELFAAVEALGRSKPLKAERLALLANGRGIAALAVDALLLDGGRLASLSETTLARLENLLPRGWPRTNPVVLDGEAPPARYAEAARTLLADPQVDVLMVLHAPVSTVSSADAGEAVIQAVREARRPALTSWMGGGRVAQARRLFADAGIPTYDTPGQAVAAFMHMVRFRRNQELLMETPTSTSDHFTPATDAARRIVADVVGRGETVLREDEARAVLSAYGIEMLAPAATPPAAAQEVLIAVKDDPVFGPVIAFGHGGPAASVIGDVAIALPPLNMSLARETLSRTRVSRLLQGFGSRPPADVDRLCLALVQVSQMIVDLPEILALEINPLLVGPHGVCALGASIQLAPAGRPAEQRLAIRPYPRELEEEFVLHDGRTVLLRPIRPEDQPAHYEFLSKVTPDDIRLRFFHHIRTLPHTEMARLTQIDYDREMAIIATLAKADGSGSETLGVVRVFSDPNNEKAEYAILIRSDLKGQGLGHKLMDKIINYCRSRGTRRIEGLILFDNRRMLDLVHRLGFTSHPVPGDDVVEVTLLLDPAA
jgi:acyl-CoA synthetase (NDP forming)/GNAT superfamily N-acetyltransferase